jgi:hypothetical protein
MRVRFFPSRNGRRFRRRTPKLTIANPIEVAAAYPAKEKRPISGAPRSLAEYNGGSLLPALVRSLL